MVGQSCATSRFDSNTRRRKRIRLKEYDYSQPGEYFVTICTKDRVHSFGAIANEQMNLSTIGTIACNCWKELPKHFPDVALDEFAVMPNHIHRIVCIIENPGRDVRSNIPTDDYHSRISPKQGSLGVIVRSYKAAVTTLCRRNSIHDFGWQPGYYDHVIRDEKSLSRIRDYIAANAQQWWSDKENSQRRQIDQFEKWPAVEGQRMVRKTER